MVAAIAMVLVPPVFVSGSSPSCYGGSVRAAVLNVWRLSSCFRAILTLDQGAYEYILEADHVASNTGMLFTRFSRVSDLLR